VQCGAMSDGSDTVCKKTNFGNPFVTPLFLIYPHLALGDSNSEFVKCGHRVLRPSAHAHAMRVGSRCRREGCPPRDINLSTDSTRVQTNQTGKRRAGRVHRERDTSQPVSHAFCCTVIRFLCSMGFHLARVMCVYPPARTTISPNGLMSLYLYLGRCVLTRVKLRRRRADTLSYIHPRYPGEGDQMAKM